MHILLLGLAVFVVSHVLPMTGAKPALKQRLGDRGYGAVFGVLSLVSLGLIVWGYSQTEYIGLYEPPMWGHHVTIFCVFAAILVLVSVLVPSHLRHWISNPLAVGFLLWAIGHLFANGDVASVVMFGTFAAYCIVSLLVRPAPEVSSKIDVSLSGDVIAVAVAAVIFFIVFAAHPYIIGVHILP